MASLSGYFSIQELSDAGALLVGGRVYTYTFGTTTFKTSYTDINGLIPHTYTSDGAGGQYIALNARGELPAPLYLAPGSYDVALKRADGSTVWTRRADPIIDMTSGVASDLASLVSDLASITVNKGASKIGFIQSVSNTYPRTVKEKLGEFISILDFIPINLHDGISSGMNTTDLASYLQNARDYLAAAPQPPELVFPAGVYLYSLSPNWNITNIRVVSRGVVRLRYTGTGNAFIVDTLAGLGAYNQYFGRFIIEAPATAMNGVRIRNSSHSTFDFNIRGCGATYAAVRVEFAVCSHFPNLTVSNNESGSSVQGWYLNAMPKYALLIDSLNGTASEPTSYCLFDNPVLEGTTIGLYADHALGNNFFGGTMEGCANQGAWLTLNSKSNKLNSVDFESNGMHDIYNEGQSNFFINCDSLTQTTFAAGSGVGSLVGGLYNKIDFVSGAINNSCSRVSYNRLGTGYLSDPNSANRMRDNYNIATGLAHNVAPKTTTLLIGPSPYTYINTSVNELCVGIGGGTVSSITFIRSVENLQIASATGAMVNLSPGDSVTVIYTAAPSMKLFSR